MGQGDPSAPYEVVELKDLDAWLEAEFTWRKTGDDWIYAGKCRRCTHDVDKRIKGGVVLAFRESGADDPDGPVMSCNCGAAHQGREGGDGCGAFWGLYAEHDDPQT